MWEHVRVAIMKMGGVEGQIWHKEEQCQHTLLSVTTTPSRLLQLASSTVMSRPACLAASSSSSRSSLRDPHTPPPVYQGTCCAAEGVLPAHLLPNSHSTSGTRARTRYTTAIAFAR